MTLLTNADKLNIVNQHMKSIDFQVYNLQLDLIEANAESPVNSETVSTLTGRMNVLNAKRVALESEAEKAELVITALQQRIGEIVSNYETQIAFLRAEITKLIEEKDAKVEAVQAYEDHLDDLTAD